MSRLSFTLIYAALRGGSRGAGQDMPASSQLSIALKAALALFIIAATPLGVSTAHAGDQISVILDRAQLFKMPETAKTLVIGNPIIADVSIIKNGLMVVTGKSYGLTNVIALDGQGRQISDTLIQVIGSSEQLVTVQRGLDQETYHCAPICNPTIRLGDGDQYFGRVGSQATKHTGLAGPGGGAGGAPAK